MVTKIAMSGMEYLRERYRLILEASPVSRKSFSDRHSSVRIEGLNLSTFENPKTQPFQLQDYRVFVGTWNVGGKTPNNSLNLEDFLQVEDSFDIYILGFQEIVPLNAGNVLVIEDNEPAAKWLALISQALNMPLEQGSNHEPSEIKITSFGQEAAEYLGHCNPS